MLILILLCIIRLEQLSSNVKLVVDATKLPIVEPFNPEQLKSHTDVILSCFVASISVAVAVTVYENSKFFASQLHSLIQGFIVC